MANLNGHEAGNGGYCQEKPVATTPLFYLATGGEIPPVYSTPFFGLVSAAGLTDKGDHLHFDSASLREFGQRYANEYLRITDREG